MPATAPRGTRRPSSKTAKAGPGKSPKHTPIPRHARASAATGTGRITDPAQMPATTAHALRLLHDAAVHTHFYFDPEFEVAAISTTRSRLGQVRAQVIDPVNLEGLKVTALHHPDFPWEAMLLDRQGPNVFVNLDGNHRREMALATGRKTMPVIVVDLAAAMGKTDALKVAQQIANAANVTHGQRTTNEERIAGAISLHHNGTPVPLAAKTMGLSVNTLRNHLKAQEGTERAIYLGVGSLWSKIDATPQAMLQRIGNTDPFKEAIRLTVANRFTTVEVKAMVDAVVAARDVNAQNKVLSDLAQQLSNRAAQVAAGQTPGRTGKQAVTGSPAFVSITRSITSIRKVLDSPNFAGAFASTAERRAAKRELTKARTLIDQRLAAL